MISQEEEDSFIIVLMITHSGIPKVADNKRALEKLRQRERGSKRYNKFSLAKSKSEGGTKTIRRIRPQFLFSLPLQLKEF